MGNSYFQFKQFTVHQERCAMKVSTDACIQGAWTQVPENAKNALDIGAGTGLLSLMLAQRYEAMHIDAVELDREAALQAIDNVASSRWREQIKVVNADVTRIKLFHQYDFVICNPPFFSNSLLGDDKSRNSVRHTLSLTHEALFEAITKALKDEGKASVLLPVAEHERWKQIVHSHGWHALQELHIVPRYGSKPNRIVSICSKEYSPPAIQELVIKNIEGDYTVAFKELMSPYYLAL